MEKRESRSGRTLGRAEMKSSLSPGPTTMKIRRQRENKISFLPGEFLFSEPPRSAAVEDANESRKSVAN